jgi:hypothetical protein
VFRRLEDSTWDFAVEVDDFPGGATPIPSTPGTGHRVTVKVNYSTRCAEVYLDGQQISTFDGDHWDREVAALRHRILTEGSWAVAARDPIDSENFEVLPEEST